jgi:hypothetical protein
MCAGRWQQPSWQQRMWRQCRQWRQWLFEPTLPSQELVRAVRPVLPVQPAQRQLSPGGLSPPPPPLPLLPNDNAPYWLQADFAAHAQARAGEASPFSNPPPAALLPSPPAAPSPGAAARGACARLNVGLSPPAPVIPHAELRHELRPCAAGSFKTVWRGTWARPGDDGGGGLDVALLHARAGDLPALRQELRVLMLLRNHPGRARARRGGQASRR